METKLHRLAIVDDLVIYRQGVVGIMKEWAKASVVLEAAHGKEYERESVNMPRIHLALVELHMPVRNGFDTINFISRFQPRTLPLAITKDPKPMDVSRALRLGAKGMLCKSVCGDGMIQAVDHLVRNGFLYNAWVDRGLRQQADKEGPKLGAIIASITAREMEFLLLYAKPPFPSVEQVAAHLGISPNGAEGLRKLVAKRIECRKREDMIQFVMKHGLGLFLSLANWLFEGAAMMGGEFSVLCC